MANGPLPADGFKLMAFSHGHAVWSVSGFRGFCARLEQAAVKHLERCDQTTAYEFVSAMAIGQQITALHAGAVACVIEAVIRWPALDTMHLGMHSMQQAQMLVDGLREAADAEELFTRRWLADTYQPRI